MTTRTKNPLRSPIEAATEGAVYDLNIAITQEWKLHQPPLPEKELRRIIALYFERLTLKEWCELLGADPPDEHRTAGAP